MFNVPPRLGGVTENPAVRTVFGRMREARAPAPAVSRWVVAVYPPLGMSWTPLPTWIVWLALAITVGAALSKRRVFAVFVAVVLGIPTYAVAALNHQLAWAGPTLVVLQLLAALHLLALVVRPSMRPAWFRWGVSVPGLGLVAAGLLALPWAVAASLGFEPWAPWIPFALAMFGTWQSLRAREETVSFVLDREDAGPLARHSSEAPTGDSRPLRIVQITDPHLGPYMSVERLQQICRRAVEREPDLILVTGDLMTMESHDVGVVTRALEPLAAFNGRVFACHGNHDHEARRVVAQAYARHGITLLDDEATVVATPAGAVQLVGLDFVWRDRAVKVPSVLERLPREGAALRVVLLHDPGAFVHIPDGDADLVLSGHTHGGQVGLLSLGLPTTVLSLFTKIPDHGPWAKGRNRLYVHRAQGHYGYPVRLGVPAEQSMLQVFDPRRIRDGGDR